jgi:hypothetical protein
MHMVRKGKERERKERKGKERKGKERKGKETGRAGLNRRMERLGGARMYVAYHLK